MTKRYFKCWKCGSLAYTESGYDAFMCVQPCFYRTSGICGGEYIKISKEEYINKLDEQNKKAKSADASQNLLTNKENKN